MKTGKLHTIQSMAAPLDGLKFILHWRLLWASRAARGRRWTSRGNWILSVWPWNISTISSSRSPPVGSLADTNCPTNHYCYEIARCWLEHFAAAFLATIQLVETVGSGQEGKGSTVPWDSGPIALYKNNNSNLYPKTSRTSHTRSGTWLQTAAVST